jgi:ubiquinone/menaquinone biosynthesis C-methylase UbiE
MSTNRQVVVTANAGARQCQRPSGWFGRFVLWRMNASHSRLTDWALGHVVVEKRFTILDVGCGGGRTVSKLAKSATEGKVYGVDHSETSIASTTRTNARWIAVGRVDVRLASVSDLPFADDTFDLVTAVETHFWWPNLSGDMREVQRVLKPGGVLCIAAEVYKGAGTMLSRLAEEHSGRTGMTLLSADEHRQLFTNSGYSDMQVLERRDKTWICAIGRKPQSSGAHVNA